MHTHTHTCTHNHILTIGAHLHAVHDEMEPTFWFDVGLPLLGPNEPRWILFLGDTSLRPLFLCVTIAPPTIIQ